MADEVAEDYRQALEDLTVTSRVEIATLTNIARESAEHGLAIAKVLQEHIEKVPPQRTLPALYVLDSVVKNVPTPYSLFFGPKLYKIFMGAYAKVDNNTRRKMEEMLRTWREPVPGSISTKPVFPREFVVPIENALVDVRNKTLQAMQSSYGQQQLLQRGRSGPPVNNRDTPTPPTSRPPSHLAGPHGQHPFPGPNGHAQHMGDPNMAHQQYSMRPHNGTPNLLPPRSATQPPAMPSAGQLPPHLQYQQQPPAGISRDKLRDDIQQLIVAEKAEFARDPLDTSKQTRLRALLDLQNVIQSPDVPQDQLMLVKDKIAELSVNMMRNAGMQQSQHAAAALPLNYSLPPASAVSYPISYTPTPPPPSVAPSSFPPPPVAVATAPPPVGAGAGTGAPLSLDALLGQGAGGALAALLAGTRARSATPTTPQTASLPLPIPPPPTAAVIPHPVAATTAAAGVPPVRATPPSSTIPQIPTAPAAAAAAPAAAAPALTTNPSALLAMLKQRGLLSNTPTPASGPGAAAPAAATATPPLPSALFPGLSTTPAMTTSAQTAPLPPSTTSASPGFVFAGNPLLRPLMLKQYRPHLLAQLGDDHLGPPCSQCGRRFRTDEEGRRAKTAHMDWHFRVHQRMADAEKRGQHRSWYVDEMDWIKSEEAIDMDSVAPTGSGTGDDKNGEGSGSNAGRQRKDKTGGSNGPKVKYIPVPEDAATVNSMCPICQEKFEMKWLDEAQEWVWMDAIMVGNNRVYHDSCHREAYGSSSAAGQQGGAGGGARRTPEPSGGVLGKRKAEDDYLPQRMGKIKMEAGLPY